MNIDRYFIYFSFFVLGFLCIEYVSLRSFSYFSKSCYVCTELHDVLPTLNFTCVMFAKLLLSHELLYILDKCITHDPHHLVCSQGSLRSAAYICPH